MIQLRHFGKTDFEQLIQWIPDETTLTNWAGDLFRFPLSARSLDWYVENTNVKNDSDAFVFAALDDGGNSVGHISLGSISWKNRSARVTRVLVGTTQRGKGCCQAMITAVLKVAFTELNLHRVSLGVYQNNLSATRCYQKAGFLTEGVHRDILCKNNEWWSLVEMSILQHEWQPGQPA